MIQEIWRPVIGYENDYEVSSFGNVRSIDKYITRSNGMGYFRKGKVLSIALDTKGYYRCALSKLGLNLCTKKVHRLVAEAFIPNKNPLLFVNHIDFNPKNNRVENLEWCTNKENIYHSINNGRLQMVADDSLRKRSINKIIKKGSLNGYSKLTEKEVLEIRKKYIPNVVTRKMLSEEYNVTISTIKDILIKRSWKHV